MRYLGAENEYSCFLTRQTKRGRKVAIEIMPKKLSELSNSYIVSDKPYGLINPTNSYFFKWIINGSKVYEDNGQIEYATAECGTVKELILTEKAGEIILRQFYDFYKEPDLYLLKRTAGKILDYDCFLGGDAGTGGSHENYAIRPSLFNKLTTIITGGETEQIIMMAHLASRIIYTGAGHILEKIENEETADSRIKFCLSPRANFIKRQIGLQSTTDRALINSRNEPLVFNTLSETKRLHLICGDLNRSDWSLYLKYGTTYLLLAYLEIAESKNVQKLIREIRRYSTLIDNPVAFIKNLSFDSKNFLSKNYKSYFGKAIITQKNILEAIKEESDRLSEIVPETTEIIEKWETTIFGFLNDGEPNGDNQRKLDWMIKKKLFENIIGDNIDALAKLDDKHKISKLLKLDLSYHRVNNKEMDLYRDLLAREFIKPLYGQKEIDFYIYNPPEGRAKRRIEMAKYALEQKLSPMSLKWESLHIFLKKTSGTKELVLNLDNEDIDELKRNIDYFRTMKYLP